MAFVAIDFLPGINEVRGEPSVGKTIFVLLACWDRIQQGKQVFLIRSEPLDRLQFIACPGLIVVKLSQVGAAFEVAEALMVAGADFVALDSLTALMPRHPLAASLAAEILVALQGRRFLCPFLVVNQARFPRPAGGVFYRSLVKRKFELRRLREDSPDLVSRILIDGWEMDVHLVWLQGEDRPAIRLLTIDEKVRFL